MKECQGLVVDVARGDTEAEQRRELADLYEDYEKFKMRNISRLEYSGYMQGKPHIISTSSDLIHLEDLAFKTNLEFIRIYFDSSMFEKISKVKSSKFNSILTSERRTRERKSLIWWQLLGEHWASSVVSL